jgi:hypothetical protein
MSTVKVAYSVNTDTVIRFKNTCQEQGLTPTRLIEGFMNAVNVGELEWYQGRIVPTGAPTQVFAAQASSFSATTPTQEAPKRGRPKNEPLPVVPRKLKLPPGLDPNTPSIIDDPKGYTKALETSLNGGVSREESWTQELEREELTMGPPPGCGKWSPEIHALWDPIDIKVKNGIRTAEDIKWIEQIKEHGEWTVERWDAGRAR